MKGQVSSFLKPIQVIIFSTIFVSMIVLFLNFDIGLREQESNFQFQKEVLMENQRLGSCLKSDQSSASFLLDQNKLEKFEKEISNSQLPCASNYNYGYNVSVKKNYLEPMRKSSVSKGGQIAILIDTSGSMGSGDLQEAESAAKSFIEKVGPGVEISLLAFSDRTTVLQDFTNDKQELKSSLGANAVGGTKLSNAMDTTTALDWNDETKSIMMVMSDGKAEYPNRLGSAGENARSEGIEVHGIMFGDGASDADTEAYTGANECDFDDAENTDGDVCWYAADGEQLLNVYEGIGSNIGGSAADIGSDSTCSLPAVPTYEGEAEVVFVADTSSSFSSKWDSICETVDRTVEEAEKKNIDLNLSIYTPSNPGKPDEGAGAPMNMDSVGSGEYNYLENDKNLPRCVSADYNNASSSSYGKGVTDWNVQSIPEYSSTEDYGLEAWGISSKWVLENHDWKADSNRRMIVLGDQVATGGPESSEAFKSDSSNSKSDEVALIENLSSKASEKNVVIDSYGGDWEYSVSSNLRPYSSNDARILMENLSSSTGGKFYELSDLEEFPDNYVDSFKRLELPDERRNFCTEKDYSFGQEYVSNSDNQRRTVYPVVVDTGSMKTPGQMAVSFRSGDLERLAGTINRIVDRGRSSSEEVSQTVRFNTDSSIETSNEFEVERKLDSTYSITGRNNDDYSIEVSDKLILGVNGNEVLSRERGDSEESVEIDFSESENSFTAYEGASLQYIAINNDEETGMILDTLRLKCEDCREPETQDITTGTDLDKEDEDYSERGGIGVFEYGSVPIDIGRTETVERPAVCRRDGERRNCNSLDISRISSLSLEPGNYLLSIEYNPDTDQVVIND